MRMSIYVVFDGQAKVSMAPVFYESDPIAIRSFENTVESKEPFVSNPEDFTLYRVGTFDDEGMVIEGEEPHRLVGGLQALKNRKLKRAKIEDLEVEVETAKGDL